MTTLTAEETLVSVPNVSLGADGSNVRELAEAFVTGGEAVLLAEPHFDPDHGRAVFTLAGRPGALAHAILAGTRHALASIDLAGHAGAHPCVGVVDVAPFVYLSPSLRGAACAEALLAADLLGNEAGVPVFLYGELAGGRSRAELRRGGPQEMAARVRRGELVPDFGPSSIAPATGATLVGARAPLLAFNLELEEPAGLEDAKVIAARIREGGEAGMPGVRAIGLELPHRGGVAQVSVNVEDHRAVPLAAVVDAVTSQAAVRETELVGLAPRAAFEGFPPGLPCRGRATLEDALGF